MEKCEVCGGNIKLNEGGTTRYYVNADQAKIDKLEQEKRELVEALGFYANYENWNFNPQSIYKDQIKLHISDTEKMGPRFWGGKRARQALSKIKKRGNQ